MNLASFSKKAALLFLLALGLQSAQAQNAIIRGTVVDDNGNPVQGANVVIPSLRVGSTCNEEGIFSISKLNEGTYQLRITFVGFDTLYKEQVVGKNQVVTLSLKILETGTRIGDIVIEDKAHGKIKKREIEVGVENVTPEKINMIPGLGTPDLAQYLQMLPGVLSTGDQGGQVYIRGGTPIQNMVLLDGAIIYSPFHSIGLFSVFDTDYLRDADVYTAAFPAQYGGRISSIMDIHTRNGNYKNMAVKAHMNPVTSGFLVEGPFRRQKANETKGSSFLFSARRCYLDLSSPVVYPWLPDTLGLPYNFTDLYGKTTFTDGSNQVMFFGFFQGDNVNYEFPANYKWNSSGGGARFRVLPSGSNLILSGNFAYSKYNSGLATVDEEFPRHSKISGFNGGLNFSYILNNINEFTYGVSFLGFTTDYEFTNSFGLITSQVFNNTEAAAYFTYKKVFRRVDPTRADSIIDRAVLEPSFRLHYFNDHSHVSPEPRLRFKYNLNRVSFTLGTGIYAQNLLSANSDRDVVNLFQGFLAAPLDVAGVKKSHTLQTAVHYLVGVQVELLPNLSTSIEGWFKDFTQLTNINRDKIFPSDPTFIVETGSARGVDLLLEYDKDEIFIQANYGLSKIDRDNGSQVYPTVFDRRHNANVLAAWQTGRLYPSDLPSSVRLKYNESKWELSARFSIGSGFPFTQTQAFFEKIDFDQNGAQTDYVSQNGSLGVLYADEINGGRLPWYHRLDLAAKRRWQIKNKMLVEAQVNILNTYNRGNIFYFDRIRYAVVKQLPFLPSAGLSVKF